MTELQGHELQILSAAITSTESKQEMARALWNPEIMVSMGIPTETIREVDTDTLKKDLHHFMEAHGIEEDEYDDVLAFYSKIYAVMRSHVESENRDKIVQRHAPGIWERRMKFIKDSGIKKGRTRKSLASMMVPHLTSEYDYNFLELNNHDLPENALCYLVSTMALNVTHKEASARTIDFLWDEMEDRTWYDMYTGVRKFEKLAKQQQEQIDS